MERLARIATLVAACAVVIGAGAGAAWAGPPSPPDFGIVDPLDHNPNTAEGPFTGSCPWPNNVDQFLPEVEKCLPKAVAWSPDGVRIVSDPMAGPDGETGAFTFWCQSRVGLHFIVTVAGLEPNTVYPVIAVGFGEIGRLRTDPSGMGVTGGVVPLAPGGYEWTITVGALSTIAGDEIGFEVL